MAGVYVVIRECPIAPESGSVVAVYADKDRADGFVEYLNDKDEGYHYAAPYTVIE